MKNRLIYKITITFLFVSLLCIYAFAGYDSTRTKEKTGNKSEITRDGGKFGKVSPAQDFKSSSINNVFFSLTELPSRNKIGVSFKGEARLQVQYRVLPVNYPNPGLKSGGSTAKNLNINGFGNNYQGPVGSPPLVRLEGEVSPEGNASIKFGYALNHIMTGSVGGKVDSSRLAIPWTGMMEARGDFKTSFGKFRFFAGNTFIPLSQLFAGWQNPRFYPYYRLPWDWYAQWGGDWSKYEDFYNNNAGMKTDPQYSSNGRVRGVAIQATGLPGKFGLNFFYGANMQTGVGLLDLGQNAVTKKTWGGKVQRGFGKSATIGYNFFVNSGFIDNVSDDRETQFMNSLDAFIDLGSIIFHPEIGFGEYKQPYGKYNGDSAFFNPNCCGGPYDSGIDEMVNIEVSLKRNVIGVPLKFNIYSLGPDIVNRNASFVNTSTNNLAWDHRESNVAWDVNGLRRAAFTHVHQLANNRRGLILVTDFNIQRLKVGVRTNVGTEIENRHNVITFEHKLNSFSRAGFRFWDAQSGPYGRLLYQYIQLFEALPITDTLIDYRKTFNVTDLDLRYKTRIFNRAIIFTNYISYQSAGDKFSPLPYVTDKAFVRVFYNEFMTYYNLSREVTLIGHLGFHKAAGNERTELSPENGKPINQISWAYGVGIDWNFYQNMGLYLRQLWMGHKDKNFILDKFRGWETTFEIKVFF
jgi:hypothetical protein